MKEEEIQNVSGTDYFSGGYHAGFVLDNRQHQGFFRLDGTGCMHDPGIHLPVAVPGIRGRTLNDKHQL